MEGREFLLQGHGGGGGGGGGRRSKRPFAILIFINLKTSQTIEILEFG